jgi:Amino acid kinase family
MRIVAFPAAAVAAATAAALGLLSSTTTSTPAVTMVTVVAAFTPPQRQQQHRRQITSPHGQRPTSSRRLSPNSNSNNHSGGGGGGAGRPLYLADEIREYRKGLSQINKRNGNGGGAVVGRGTPPASSAGGEQTMKPNKKVTDCVFKFGGSSLANADRIDHVAKLIRDQIADSGVRPRAVVCSAMGKTTNNLLSAGEFALGTCVRENEEKKTKNEKQQRQRQRLGSFVLYMRR